MSHVTVTASKWDTTDPPHLPVQLGRLLPVYAVNLVVQFSKQTTFFVSNTITRVFSYFVKEAVTKDFQSLFFHSTFPGPLIFTLERVAKEPKTQRVLTQQYH